MDLSVTRHNIKTQQEMVWCGSGRVIECVYVMQCNKHNIIHPKHFSISEVYFRHETRRKGKWNDFVSLPDYNFLDRDPTFSVSSTQTFFFRISPAKKGTPILTFAYYIHIISVPFHISHRMEILFFSCQLQTFFWMDSVTKKEWIRNLTGLWPGLAAACLVILEFWCNLFNVSFFSWKSDINTWSSLWFGTPSWIFFHFFACDLILSEKKTHINTYAIWKYAASICTMGEKGKSIFLHSYFLICIKKVLSNRKNM